MKNIIVPALILFSIPAFAAKVKDAKCSDMSTVNQNVMPQYMAVIDGYDKSGKKVGEEVDMESIVTESKNVNAQCAKDTSKRAFRKVIRDARVSNAPAVKMNPMKAKCQDFIALKEEVQPVAVFWVAGHDKSGKLKDGEVDEEFLERPITTLVEDCRAQPKASFYRKTKTWLKQHV
jgi:acid stress chaperone HdeA